MLAALLHPRRPRPHLAKPRRARRRISADNDDISTRPLLLLRLGRQGWRESRLLLCCGSCLSSDWVSLVWLIELIYGPQKQVQSGGSFDVDWVVTDPKDTIVIEGERDRQGDYIFTAQLVGEYSFCFRWV